MKKILRYTFFNMRKGFLFLALLLLWGLVLAARPQTTQAAGFAKQSIFLSTDSPAAGDSILVYVVLSNDTDQPFTGVLKLYDSGGLVGTTSVALAAGKAETASIPWEPAAGVQPINAVLETGNGLTTVESQDATFTVEPRTAPSSSDTSSGSQQYAGTPVESSQAIEQSIANVSPNIARDSQPLFSGIDNARTAAAGALDRSIGWSGQQLKKPNPTATTPAGGFVQKGWGLFVGVLLWLLTAARYAVANIGIFYPAFALVFFFILWRLFRRTRTRY